MMDAPEKITLSEKLVQRKTKMVPIERTVL